MKYQIEQTAYYFVSRAGKLEIEKMLITSIESHTNGSLKYIRYSGGYENKNEDELYPSRNEAIQALQKQINILKETY